MTTWFYSKEGERRGPVTTAELRALAVAKKLSPSDLIWKEGMAGWAPASSVGGLFASGGPPPLPPPVPTVAASSTSRNPASEENGPTDKTDAPTVSPAKSKKALKIVAALALLPVLAVAAIGLLPLILACVGWIAGWKFYPHRLSATERRNMSPAAFYFYRACYALVGAFALMALLVAVTSKDQIGKSIGERTGAPAESVFVVLDSHPWSMDKAVDVRNQLAVKNKIQASVEANLRMAGSYRVIVGPYHAQSEAEKVAAQLASQGYQGRIAK